MSRTPSPQRHGQTSGGAGRRRSSATPTTGADRPPSRVFMRHPKTAGPECLHRRPSSGGWRPPATRDRRIPWGTLRTTFSPAVGGPLAAPIWMRGGFEAPLRPRPGGQKMVKTSSNRRSLKYYDPNSRWHTTRQIAYAHTFQLGYTGVAKLVPKRGDQPTPHAVCGCSYTNYLSQSKLRCSNSDNLLLCGLKYLMRSLRVFLFIFL